MSPPVLLWLGEDLRLADQPALLAAMAEGPVVAVYVLDDESPRHRRMGGASRWWLHHSLAALDADLRARGSRLMLRRGRWAEELPRLAAALGTRRVHAIRHHEPWRINAERAVGKALDLALHDGNELLPVGSVTTGSGGPYKIYTPFSRAVLAQMPPAPPKDAPTHIPAPADWPASDDLGDWGLLPTNPNWAKGFEAEWTPGEAGAATRLAAFAAKARTYHQGRNLPSEEGSSRLSPHLHFGEIAPNRVWHGLEGSGEGVDIFRKELIWRDYARNIIRAMPDYGRANGRPQLDALPWRSEAEAADDIEAWQQGRTGYPIVDAGMRQLWTSGWMHNRVRMIAASFLVKHLLVDWRVGEAWFWDTLVDADYASNAVNWQWVAGSGVDANMFVRIMAPLTQSEKFDAAGYIRQWVPELAGLPDAAIHDPEAAGARPANYPAKIIGHRQARERALAAYATVRGA
jgi:deoxyribodipyrimidine photo-lyase